MNKIKRGVVYGIAYGVLDILPMLGMEFPDKTAAIVGAFTNRFSIGLLVPLLSYPTKGWQRGLMLGLLLSIADAIITKAYAPILISGIIGGFVIGVIDDRMNSSKN